MTNFIIGFIVGYVFVDLLLIIADFTDKIIVFDSHFTHFIFLPIIPLFLLEKGIEKCYYFIQKRRRK